MGSEYWRRISGESRSDAQQLASLDHRQFARTFRFLLNPQPFSRDSSITLWSISSVIWVICAAASFISRMFHRARQYLGLRRAFFLTQEWLDDEIDDVTRRHEAQKTPQQPIGLQRIVE